MKSFYTRLFQIIRRVQILVYTQVHKYQFASFGEGSYIEPRAKLIEPYLINIGSNVTICEHAWLNAKNEQGEYKPTLYIGDGVSIGRFTHINAWRQVIIEEDVLLADRVFISDADHNYQDLNIPIIQQGDCYKGSVRLKKGCWIGIGVVILPGVTIGQNSIVGANSVVTKDIPDYSIAVGAPAKVIKVLNK